MRILLILFLLSNTLFSSCDAQPKTYPKMKSIEVGGMFISWRFESKKLIVNATAPDKGWVGIGFNPKDDIVHTNLIMAGVDAEKSYLSERYVLGFGNHQSVASLGSEAVVNLLDAKEENGTTSICFAIPCDAKDKFHYNLHEGLTIYLICAFSMEDDLTHHSRMRQHVKIVL